MLAYLSGSIEYAPDHGKGWRGELTPFLRALGHQVYDPALDHKKNLTDEEVRDFRGWKRTDLPRFQATVRKIIAWDLDWIEHKCDYVLAFWDQAAQRGGGTGAEVTLAHRRGIPVYLVLGVPVEQVSGWILGCATRVFPGFEELQEYLGVQFAENALPSCERDPIELH
jgi:nucleoside 2-deoxyribosyltransferase